MVVSPTFGVSMQVVILYMVAMLVSIGLCSSQMLRPRQPFNLGTWVG